MTVTPAMMPNIRYKDALAAIDFLCAGFGFEKRAVCSRMKMIPQSFITRSSCMAARC